MSKYVVSCDAHECPRLVTTSLKDNPRKVALALGWQVELAANGEPSMEEGGFDYCPEHKEKKL